MLFAEFKKFVLEETNYKNITLCRIDRKHPVRGENSLRARGYKENKDMTTSILWKEVGEEEEISHEMIFWTKSLERKKEL